MSVTGILEQGRAIGETLKKCASSVQELGGARWTFSLGKGTRIPANARVDEGWLTLDAADGGNEEDRPVQGGHLWNMLLANAWANGAARPVLNLRDGTIHARADIALDEDLDVSEAVARACQDCVAVLKRKVFAADRGSVSPQEQGDSEVGITPASADLQRLLREAGWPVVERAGGRLSVELDVPKESHHAVIAPRENEGFDAIVVILGPCALGPVSRTALARMLLEACGLLRMVRPVARERGEEAVVSLETAIDARPASSESVIHALSALSVACRFCAREARALQVEGVAREYLNDRGGLGGRSGEA